jgi:hypothetical protein
MIRIDPSVFAFVAANPAACTALCGSLSFIEQMIAEDDMDARGSFDVIVRPVYEDTGHKLFKQHEAPKAVQRIVALEVEGRMTVRVPRGIGDYPCIKFVKFGYTSYDGVFSSVEKMKEYGL